MDDVRAVSGLLVLDLVLPGAVSPKDLRHELRSLLDRLRRLELAAAQVGPTDLQQRAWVAVSAVSNAAHQVDALLEEAERLAFASPFAVTVAHRGEGVWSGPSRP
jgi:uncharacterized protein YlxP (DUF503 family)